MLLLYFLLLPMALTMGGRVPNEIYNLKIVKNTLKEIRIIDQLPDDLDLSNLGLKAIDEKVFHHLSNLKTLNLAGNSLKYLPKFVFANLTNLEYLDLANNDLSSGKFYNGLRNLKILNISGNRVSIFEPGHFFGLSKSINIMTQGLTFSYITTAMFENPSMLTRRSSNIHKVCIQDGRLKSLEDFNENETLANYCYEIEKNTESLYLGYLGIRAFENKWYRLQDHNVISLNFENNEIPQIVKQLLNDLPREIINVSLARNKIERLERGVIENENLIVLDLSKNRISEIEDGAFEKLNLVELFLDGNRLRNTKFLDSLPSNIRTVSLINNEICEISVGNFAKYTNFFTLDLSHNKITEAKAQRLLNFSSLKELRLMFNGLKNVEPGFFKDLKNLVSVNFDSNDISNLENGVFSGLENIVDIYLNDNNLTEIRNGVFSEMPDTLQSLSLTMNRIQILRAGTFVNVPKRALYLDGNEIAKIEKGSFKNLNHLPNLVLSNNRIKKLENGALSGFSKTAVMKIDLIGVRVEVIQGGLFDDGYST